jgi:hypothetical protein
MELFLAGPVQYRTNPSAIARLANAAMDHPNCTNHLGDHFVPNIWPFDFCLCNLGGFFGNGSKDSTQ